MYPFLSTDIIPSLEFSTIVLNLSPLLFSSRVAIAILFASSIALIIASLPVFITIVSIPYLGPYFAIIPPPITTFIPLLEISEIFSSTSFSFAT